MIVRKRSSESSRLDSFLRILRLEGERGYDDRAVLGGLDRFLERWRQELESSGQGEALARLTELGVFPGGYGRLSPAQREPWSRKVMEAMAHPDSGAATAGVPPETDTPGPYRSRQTRPTPSNLSLDSPVTVVRGVGPGIATKLRAIGIQSVRDLLYHFPRRHLPMVWIRDLAPDEEQGVLGTVWEVRVIKLGGPRMEATEAILGDETGNIRVLWFNQPFVARTVRPNSRLMVSGRLRPFRGQRTLDATSYETVEESDETFQPGRLAPVYPSTEGLTQRTLRRVIRRALDPWLSRLPDFLPEEVGRRQKLLHLADALQAYHYPSDETTRVTGRRRLAFDELFLTQLSLLSHKRRRQAQGVAVPLSPDQKVMDSFLGSLPFSLTGAQRRALDEIMEDIARPWPMGRLLQGEVGSGKTVVALAAMLTAVAHGCQAAMMAPTEILAEQHFLTVTRLLQGLPRPAQEPNRVAVYMDPHPRPIVVGLLLGSMRAREKRALQEGLARREVDLVVGTHALIQGEVTMPNLTLAVVDEQHRFGVMQRRALEEKGTHPHLLSMSATPIPRSLALTLYGDLDVSVIDELPQGRQRVRTRWLRPDQRGAAYDFVRRQVETGRQAFVVCPLIEESEVLQTRAALREHRRLSREVFPDLRVGLLHGRMPLTEKTAVMEQFREGEVDILVSTPVVEVGVDVPNATVVLIEGADRFGLSELHQFRGRVGRGEHSSYCLLQADDPSPEAQERLAILEREPNGFRVAEEDLRLRGPGELLGTRQSGLPDFKLAGLSDMELLVQAREEASRLLAQDPELERPEHQAVAAAVAPLQQALEERATAA